VLRSGGRRLGGMTSIVGAGRGFCWDALLTLYSASEFRLDPECSESEETTLTRPPVTPRHSALFGLLFTGRVRGLVTRWPRVIMPLGAQSLSTGRRGSTVAAERKGRFRQISAAQSIFTLRVVSGKWQRESITETP
jgi:hypothetical protein